MTVKVIVGYLRLMQRVLQHYQLDLKDIGVSETLVQQFYAYLEDDEKNDFDAEQYAQLLYYLQAKFERPISLVVAEQVALQDAGMMGYLASTSVDLQQALQLLQQYYPLLYKQTNIETLRLVEQKHSVQLYWIGQFKAWRNFCEMELAILYRITKLVVQQELIPPEFAILGYAPEFSIRHYVDFFNCPVKIIDKKYGVQFPKHVLSVRSIAADLQINQLLSHQAEQSLQQKTTFAQQQIQFKQKIMQLIEQGIQQQCALQPFVAAQLHCSERTLQRDLKSYSLHFQDLLDEYRMQKSIFYLQQGKSLMYIAEQLNYADQSAFGRAFKRWTGRTPKQYLQQADQS